MISKPHTSSYCSTVSFSINSNKLRLKQINSLLQGDRAGDFGAVIQIQVYLT